MFPDLSQIDIVSLDTETTGLTNNDRPVGASVSLPDGRDFYFAWGHPTGNNCSASDFVRWSKDQLRDKNVVMHNGPFDMRMTSYIGCDPFAWRPEDTGTIASLLNELEPSFKLDDLCQKYTGRSKSDDELNRWCAEHFGGQATRNAQAKNYHRAPGDIVAGYAKGDSRMTLDLHSATRSKLTGQGLDGVYALECDQLPIILRMHLVGVRVDVERATELQRELVEERARLEAEWDRETGGVNYGSTPQLAKLFDELGLPYPVNPPTEKMLARGITRGNPSIDKEVLEGLADHHPLPSKIVRMKKLKHFADTFIGSYVLSNVDDEGIVHGEFHPNKREKYGTVSGRYSSGGGLNLQNIPARDPVFAPMIRGLYIPYTPEHDWTRLDYSQIEYRFLAHYAGGALRRAYQEDPDIDFHQWCSDISGIPRKPAKNLNFGVVYGQGRRKTAATLGVTLEVADEFLATYHARVPEVRMLMDRAINRAQSRGEIVTWGGRKRRFDRDERGRVQKAYKALNALLQGSAADLMKRAMVEVYKIIDWQDAILHLTVHDELDLSTTRGEVGDVYRRRIKEAMEDFELTVPIRAEVEVGEDWGHCEEWKVAA